MNRKINLLIFLICFCFSISFGQKASSDLIDKRLTIKMQEQPLGVVFRYLMENYDIPIGFEESVLDRGLPDFYFHTNSPTGAVHRQQTPDGFIKMTTTSETVFKAKRYPITLNIENGRLEDVFNQIVEQMENYKWEMNDGIINIFPIKGRDKKFAKLLELPIERFTFEKRNSVEDITTKIQLLPEFGRFMHKNKLHFSGLRTGMNFVLKVQYGRKIEEEMDFSNLTFRSLLNKITKIKKGGWILKWKYIAKESGKEFIDIDI